MKTENKEPRGGIFNIQPYCVHDGPGIRTVIFLKGCPLRCAWCSNPESQHRFLEPGYNKAKCLRCRACVKSCPLGALEADAEAHPVRAFSRCDPRVCVRDGTLPCVGACPGKAMFTYGRTVSVTEVFDEVEKESLFYSRSGGGITLSGGEALFQPEFSLEVLRRARADGIHTALETSACVSADIMRAACARLDYLIMDIKHLDDEVHTQWTGVHNAGILSNFLLARREFPHLPIKVRTPLIPGVNDTEEAIRNIVDFLKPFPRTEYEILPYHALGEQKYTYLGRTYALGAAQGDHERTKRLQDMAAEMLGDRGQAARSFRCS